MHMHMHICVMYLYFVLAQRWLGPNAPRRLVAAPPLDNIRDYFGEKVCSYTPFPCYTLHHATRTPLTIATLLNH